MSTVDTEFVPHVERNSESVAFRSIFCTRGGWCGQSVVLASAGKYVDGMTPKSSRQELGPVSHLQLAPNRQFRCALSMLH